MGALLNIQTPDQVNASIEQGNNERYELQQQVSGLSNQPVMSAIAARVTEAWARNKDAKQLVEEEILQCLRDRNGKYDPATEAAIRAEGGSDIYVPLITTKIRAAVGHIKPVVMPVGEIPFGIEPTPMPELPDWIKQAAMSRMMQTEAPQVIPPRQPGMDQAPPQGQMNPQDRYDQLEETLKREMEMFGKRAARNMEKKIRDQQIEGGWDQAMADFIDDFCTFPTAIFKGPYFTSSRKLTWRPTPDGWKPMQSVETGMKFSTIHPLDAYPSPGACNPQEGEFIERRHFTRGQLYDLQRVKGYSKRAIQDVLIEYGQGGLRNWIGVDSVRSVEEQKDRHFLNESNGKIEALHFYGPVMGVELLEWGIPAKQIEDPLAEYECEAVLIGRHVIRAEVNRDPLYRRPIHSASYEKVPGAFWGNAIAKLMRSRQRVYNACWRAMSNNFALASGPQIEVHYDRLAEETNPFEIFPNKVWQTKSSELTGNDPAVRFFQPDSNVDSLMKLAIQAQDAADDDTGIPRFVHGGDTQGAGDTARGLAMLMDASAKLLRLAISNIDYGVVRPIVGIMYDHNMLNDPDPTIKGDAQVVPRGANALLQRESARESYMQLLEITNNPVDLGIIGDARRAKMLKELVRTYPNLPSDIVPSSEDFQKERAMQPPAPDPEAMKLDAQKEQADKKLQSEQQKHGIDIQSREKIEQMRNQARMDELRLRMKGEMELARMQMQNAVPEGTQVDPQAIKTMIDQATKPLLDQIAKLTSQQQVELANVKLEFEKRLTADMEKRTKEKEADMKARADEQKKASESSQESNGASAAGEMTFNFNIDASHGTTDKTVRVRRDREGKIESADIKGAKS